MSIDNPVVLDAGSCSFKAGISLAVPGEEEPSVVRQHPLGCTGMAGHKLDPALSSLLSLQGPSFLHDHETYYQVLGYRVWKCHARQEHVLELENLSATLGLCRPLFCHLHLPYQAKERWE